MLHNVLFRLCFTSNSKVFTTINFYFFSTMLTENKQKRLHFLDMYRGFKLLMSWTDIGMDYFQLKNWRIRPLKLIRVQWQSKSYKSTFYKNWSYLRFQIQNPDCEIFIPSDICLQKVYIPLDTAKNMPYRSNGFRPFVSLE